MKNIDIEEQLNISCYKRTINKRIEYLNNKKITNKSTNEEYKFQLNEEHIAKQELMWYTYNVIALNEQYSNDKHVAFFVTLTLQSQFHKFKKYKNRHCNNPKYNISNTVNLSYKILNKFFRDISKNFRRAKMRYLQERFLEKALNGVTSINEMVRIFASNKCNPLSFEI